MAYAHTAWKYQVARLDYANPIISYAGTLATVLSSVEARSASALTVVRTRYDLTLTGTIVLTSAGQSPTRADWWSDLMPCYRVYAVTTPFGPYQDPFGAGFGETDGTADGGFHLDDVVSGFDPSTGHPTQTVVWNASGNTEGKRTFPAPADVYVKIGFGFNFNSYAAGYGGVITAVEWSLTGYTKTLFGSASGIT